MATGKDNWIRVSRESPCPICGKPDNCCISRDGKAVLCGRVESNWPPNGGGQWRHQLQDGMESQTHPVLSGLPVKVKPLESKPIDWEKNNKVFCERGKDKLPVLAKELGVDVEALRRLSVGTSRVYNKEQWTFPERDATGSIIGIVRRDFVTGKKKSMSGGKRGLTFSICWHTMPGPIYLVEGASDTAALMTMGCCAIGRPSNCGGFEHLAGLLQDHPNRQIIVLGERDQDEITKLWPGRTGAVSTARQLTERLCRPISWALPPEGFKDVRDYLNCTDSKPHWELDLETIDPPPPPEPYLPPCGPQRSLEDWRIELTAVRLEALKKHGIYFDGSPTGAGKSYADRVAMRKAGTSLTLVPTHQNGDELVAELIEAGLDAAKLPARASPEAEEAYLRGQENNPSKIPWNYGICNNTSEVEQAESFGLSAGTAVCPSCSYRDNCDFLESREEAMAASHLVATHMMYASNSKSLSDGRQFISVHEDATEMLRPTVSISPADLTWVLSVAAEASWLELDKLARSMNPNPDLVGFFNKMADKVKELTSLIKETNVTTVFRNEAASKAPRFLQRKILEACNSLIARGEIERSKIKAAAMKFVLDLITGRLACWAICVNTIKASGGQDEAQKRLVAAWNTPLPENTPIIFSDATGSADNIAELTGLNVQDITPEGHLARQSLIYQITHDINRQTSLTTVVKLIAAVMLRHPEANRIGIIAHKPHIKAITDENSTLGSLRQRIHKYAYFGEGSDRASNDWHTACDLLIVLGTPRVPPMAIWDWLIQIGKLGALKSNGGWGSRLWEAETVGGGRRCVKGSGYSDPDWRRAADGQVKAALQQAVGRGRCYQQEGIPTVVCSNEPLGLPVLELPDEPKPLSEGALKCLLWLEVQIAKTLIYTSYTFCNFTTATTSASTGLPTDRCSKALRELVAVGYVQDCGHGKWALANHY